MLFGDLMPSTNDYDALGSPVRAGPRVEVVLGDIARAACDAVVNSICPTLATGGAVDRAVRRLGGVVITQQLERVARERFPVGMPVSGSVATGAGDLPCRWLVHAAGPRWDGTVRANEELYATYAAALQTAADLGAASVAVPALCVGGCRFPVAASADIGLRAARATTARLQVVRFVLSDRYVYADFVRAFVGKTNE
jgi:O-acetyl-ADP-ribose deacetylase